MAGETEELFVLRRRTTSLPCPGCQEIQHVTRPVFLDWRDRRALEELDRVFPSAACSSCGTDLAIDLPVLLTRPGDPVEFLVSGNTRSEKAVAVLTEILTEHVPTQSGRTTTPVAVCPAEIFTLVGRRYLGFAVQAMTEPNNDIDEAAKAWINDIRHRGDWPDLRSDLARYLTSDPDRLDLANSLLEETWQPVIRRLGRETAAAQPTPDQARAVRLRMRELARLRHVAEGADAGDAVVAEALELLADVVARQANPNRTVDDVRHGVASGRRLLSLLDQHGLSGTSLAITATNDTAALMLDDPDQDHGEALRMLTARRTEAARRQLASLTDITTNHALAHLRSDRIAGAEELDHVIALLEDALHLHALYFPDAPERSLSLITNLATMYRSRLTGDPSSNTDRALGLFGQARAIDDELCRLTRPDRIMLDSNYVSALTSRFKLVPTQDDADRLLTEIDNLAPRLEELGRTHPTRLRSLTNFGSIAVELLATAGIMTPAGLSERGEAWFRTAIDALTGTPASSATAVLARSGLAALLGQRGPDGYSEAEDLLTSCVHDLDGSPATLLHHTVVDNLARLHLWQGHWDQAIGYLEQACRWADDTIASASTQAARLAHIAAAGDLYQRLALCYTQQRDARSAIHTVERARARWIASADVDEAIAERLTPGSALLYLGTTSIGSYAVILIAGRGAGAWTATLRTTEILPTLLQIQQAEAASDLMGPLDECATLLHRGLLNPLAEILRGQNIHTLNIIAGGPLSGLPLHALTGPHGTLAQHASIRYLVNAHATNAPAPASPAALAVANPTGDLPFAASEIDAVRSYLPHTHTPPPAVGVRGWLTTHLPTTTHLHLACHARYDPADPFASHFVLGDNLRLTISDIARIGTPNLELVVATACQSGVTDQRGADELVGLAHALLAAGAQSAVAALWKIRDISTAVLIALFYRAMAAGSSPAAALEAAAHTIRDADIAELAEWAAADWLPEALRPQLRAMRYAPRYRDPAIRPFEHPAHWAGLVYIQR